MVLNSQQRQIGKDNYEDAVRITRRQLLAGAAVVPTAAAMYWGYKELTGDPVRVAVIGTGDQGTAHIKSMNPAYLKMVAFSDIRPSNQKAARDLLDKKFGPDAKGIKLYEDYHELLADPNVEMVIIAVPLFQHAEVSIAALRAGKHVLCEKLMAKTVTECKDMVREADKAKRLLAIGHQRHYSYLYANCLSIIEQNEILGDIRHIRAFWHRNQTGYGAKGAEMGTEDSWSGKKKLLPEDANVDVKKYGYESLDELVHWRIRGRTGAGLMAELGSHQLDAASIFLGKVHPIAVQGTGVKSFFKDNREIEDHIFLAFEFPGEVVVTYSSISTNAFDGYGEQVMGTKGTMVVQEEKDAYLFSEMPGGAGKDTRITWAENRISRPTTEAGSSTQWVASVDVPDTLTSRGYREEQEHLAWIIRNGGVDCEQKPRCNGRVALIDAAIALTANLAMKHKQRIAFKPEWFDPASDAAPEKDFPNA